MSEEEALEVAGASRAQAGTDQGRPGGCIFFPLPNEQLADVLQICFDESGLTLVVTALSKSQPAPPEDASPGRAALIGRADSTCQSMYGHLGEITGELQRALGAFSDDMTPSNRSEVARLMDRFIDNLVDTQSRSPPSKHRRRDRDADGVHGRAELADRDAPRARRAIVAEDIDAYSSSARRSPPRAKMPVRTHATTDSPSARHPAGPSSGALFPLTTTDPRM